MGVVDTLGPLSEMVKDRNKKYKTKKNKGLKPILWNRKDSNPFIEIHFENENKQLFKNWTERIGG